VPILSGLQSAEGGLETGLGWFGVKWNVSEDNVLTVETSTPEGTSGTVTLPGSGDLTVDGEPGSGSNVELSGGSHVLTRNLS
jgi:hypothetical protein